MGTGSQQHNTVYHCQSAAAWETAEDLKEHIKSDHVKDLAKYIFEHVSVWRSGLGSMAAIFWWCMMLARKSACAFRGLSDMHSTCSMHYHDVLQHCAVCVLLCWHSHNVVW